MADERPDEKHLRNLLAGTPVENRLDPAQIISRSRARRLPRQWGSVALGALVIAGIGTVAVQGSLSNQVASDTALEYSTGQSEAVAPVEERRVPADRINLCESPVADIAPSPTGLQLDVEFPSSAAAGTAPVTGTVRLTNTSSVVVSGTTAAAPALTLSQAGTVVWHSNGPMILSVTVVDLAPGESLVYEASFAPVRCSASDDLAEGFPAGLPALAPGEYELSALLDFAADEPAASTTEIDLLSGQPSAVTLE